MIIDIQQKKDQIGNIERDIHLIRGRQTCSRTTWTPKRAGVLIALIAL